MLFRSNVNTQFYSPFLDSAILVDHAEVPAQSEDPFHELRIPPPTSSYPQSSSTSEPDTATEPENFSPPSYNSGSWGSFQPRSQQSYENTPKPTEAGQREAPPSFSEGSWSSQSKWPNQSRGVLFDVDDTYANEGGVSGVRTSAQMRGVQSPITEPPPDFMPWSVISMLCCCLCLGIGAVYYSTETRTHIRNSECCQYYRAIISMRSNFYLDLM